MTQRQTTIFSGLVAAGAAALLLLGANVMRAADSKSEPTTRPTSVSVKLINAAGELVGPVEVPFLALPESEWEKKLSKDQCYVLRKEGTERPGSGELLKNKAAGVYVCAACSLPLFVSDAKFESGTGWPSFFEPIYAGNVRSVEDRSHGMLRVESECARCGGHLGHLFDDGPPPTGKRFCMNSLSLKFVKNDNLKSLADAAANVAAPATQPAR